MNYDQQIELRVSTVYGGATPNAEKTVEIEMRDKASRELLGQVQLPASDAWALFTGSLTIAPGFWSPNLHRLGKTMETERIHLGRAPSQVGYDEADQRQWAMNVARGRDESVQYETTEVRPTNSGWDAIFRRWV